MSKTPSMPPIIPIPEIPKLSEEELKNIDWEKVKQNPAMQKYEKRITERKQRKAAEELKRKKEQRSEWWKTNAIGIITLIIALATLIVTAIK